MPESADIGRSVVLGAHYDTVPDSPGANDNASGIATIMTIAKHVAGNSYPFAVEFVLFGSEEIGLYGSRHYVDALGAEGIDSTIAMLNFDTVGAGSKLGVLGSPDLIGEAMRLGERFGPNLVRNNSPATQREQRPRAFPGCGHPGDLSHVRRLFPHTHAGRQAPVD